MSDTSDKPFDATPARIRKARREGDVARSSELPASLAFAAGALTLAAIAPLFAAAARSAIGGVEARAPGAIAALFGIALLPALASAAAATVGTLLQHGGMQLIAVGPKLQRLDPIGGLKRMLSRDTVAHSLRAALAFLCAGAAMAPFVGWCGVALMRAPPIEAAVAGTWASAQRVAFAACAVGLVFAVAEHGAARRTWLRKLRMSFDERKREVKEEEGDATARGRRRALHRALLRGGIRHLKDAAFVVVNPQHVAVALEYRPPHVPVPRMLLRAADAAAAMVRTTAERYGIPVVENPSLARALYRDGRPGEAIARSHYVAVAQVVAALLRVRPENP